MKMNLTTDIVEGLYKQIANNDVDAVEFLKFWSLYTHKFDDLVDEEFNVIKLVECNNEIIRLMSCKFFQRNQIYLIGQIYLAAESYIASEDLKFSSRYEERIISQYLSHEGNNMLFTVALITGGWELLRKVAPIIRTLTYQEHPLVTTETT